MKFLTAWNVIEWATTPKRWTRETDFTTGQLLYSSLAFFFFFFLLPKVEFPLSMFHVGSKGRTYVLDLKLVRWEKRSRHGIYFWPRVVHYRHALTINPFSKAHVDYYDLSFFSLTEKNPHASASWDLLLNVVLTQMQSWFPWKLYGEVHFSHNSHSK